MDAVRGRKVIMQSVSQTSLCMQISQVSDWNEDSDSVVLGCDLKFYISNKLPGDTEGAGLWIIVWVARIKKFLKKV